MSSGKTIFGLVTLIIIHLTWLFIPTLYGFEWMNLSPALLVVSCFILGFFHRNIDSRFVSYAGIVFVVGFVLSAIGANTGNIFGSFFFGKNLGILVWDTPLVIGLVWLILSYSTSVTAAFFTQKSAVLNKPVMTILLASIFMLIVVLLLEQIASESDFWYWKYQQAPFQNYSAWFVFAVAFNFLFQRLEVDTTNNMARWFLVLFVLLLIGLKVLPAYSFAS